MSELAGRLDDAAIEAMLARRVPGHADRVFLNQVVAVATAQRPERRRILVPSLRRPRRAWLVLAAAAVLMAGLLVVGAGSKPHRPVPTAPIPSQAAVAPQETPSSAVGPCDRPNLFRVGSAMTATSTHVMTVPAGVLDVGAYVTATRSLANPVNLWAIRSGPATRIAQLDNGRVHVYDISADGGQVLVSGEAVDAMTQQSCDRLAVVASDGSGIIELGAGDEPAGRRSASFSPDGRFVVSMRGVHGTGPDVDIADLGTSPDLHSYACTGRRPPVAAHWAPTGDRVAAVCGTSILVIDAPTGQTATIAIPYASGVPDPTIPGDVRWLDGSRLAVMTSSNGLPRGQGTVVVPAGPLPARLTLSDLVPTMVPDGTVSPDGRHAADWEDTGTGQARSNGVLLDLRTGRRTTFMSDIEITADDPLAWSTDGAHLVFRLPAGATDPGTHLVILDVGSGIQTRYNDLPHDMDQGFWRLP